MAAWSAAWVCSRLVAGIPRSNPAEGMAVRLLWVVCVVYVAASATSWSLVQRSPTLCVCVCVYDLETLQEATWATEKSIIGLEWLSFDYSEIV